MIVTSSAPAERVGDRAGLRERQRAAAGAEPHARAQRADVGVGVVVGGGSARA